MKRIRLKFTLLIVAFSFVACVSKQQLDIPKADTVSSIELRSSTQKGGSDVGAELVIITDTVLIGKIVSFIESINNNLKVPPYTFPTPLLSLVFNDSENKNLVLYLAKDWIGGRNDVGGRASQNRLRSIDETTVQDLLDLLNIANL